MRAHRRPSDHTYEEGAEHLLAVDALGEARLPCLDRARHVVEAAIEDEVGEVPRYELLVGCVEQTIFRGDLTPQVGLVGHVGREWHRDWLGDLHFEHTGDARPHVLPTELVAVRDIDDFVARSRSDTGPNGRRCQKVCGTDLIESAIGVERAGEAQWNPKLLGDGRINGNRHAQIHWVAGGVTDDRLGAQSRPMPRLSDPLAPQKILLVIVKVRRHQARIVLAGRRLERPEVGAIRLAALIEGHVAQSRRRRLDHLDEVLQNRHVHSGPLGRTRFLDVGREDEVRHTVEPTELALDILPIEQVDRNALDTFGKVGVAAGQAVDLGVPCVGPRGGRPPAGHAVYSGDENHVLRAHSKFLSVTAPGAMPSDPPASPEPVYGLSLDSYGEKPDLPEELEIWLFSHHR